jgi:RNA polymerase sporulation-specific sigma factor
MSVDSLQRESGEDGLTLENALGTPGIEEGIVERVALHEAVGILPERERMVVALRYFRNLTQQQTARIMGISQVQVSRIERGAITALREHMR